MRTHIMRKLIITILLIVTGLAGVWANPLDSHNHGFNPALLGVRNRGLIELGLVNEIGIANSSLFFGDLLQEELVLDFNKIYDDLGDNDYNISLASSTGAHLAVSLFGISVGAYTELNTLNSFNVSNGLVKFLAEGNSIDTTESGSSTSLIRMFFEAGLYGGYRWNDFQFGAKLGGFSPLIYTGSGSRFSYSYSTNTETGVIEGEAHVSMPYYSVFDLGEDGEMSGTEFLTGMNGVNASLGAIKVNKNKAMYGVSITGLTVVPAMVTHKGEFTMDASVTITNIAQNIEDEDTLVTENIGDPEFTTLEEGSYSISTPLQVGGFYRLTGFPFFIDWIGHAQVTFDDEIQYGGGVTAEGAFFPFSWFSLGLEYDRVLWKALLGMKADLHVFELGLDLGLTGPQFLSMATASGVYGKMYMAFGF